MWLSVFLITILFRATVAVDLGLDDDVVPLVSVKNSTVTSRRSLSSPLTTIWSPQIEDENKLSRVKRWWRSKGQKQMSSVDQRTRMTKGQTTDPNNCRSNKANCQNVVTKFQLDSHNIPSGISIVRKVQLFPEGASFVLHMDPRPITKKAEATQNTLGIIQKGNKYHRIATSTNTTSFCSPEDNDMFGDNNCHYDWGDVISGTIEAHVGSIGFDEGDMVYVDMMLDSFIPFHIHCPLCSDVPCAVTIPIVNEHITIPTAPCPILPYSSIKQHFQYKLPNKCPIPKEIENHIDGTIRVDVRQQPQERIRQQQQGQFIQKKNINISIAVASFVVTIRA